MGNPNQRGAQLQKPQSQKATTSTPTGPASIDISKIDIAQALSEHKDGSPEKQRLVEELRKWINSQPKAAEREDHHRGNIVFDRKTQSWSRNVFRRVGAYRTDPFDEDDDTDGKEQKQRTSSPSSRPPHRPPPSLDELKVLYTHGVVSSQYLESFWASNSVTIEIALPSREDPRWLKEQGLNLLMQRLQTTVGSYIQKHARKVEVVITFPPPSERVDFIVSRNWLREIVSFVEGLEHAAKSPAEAAEEGTEEGIKNYLYIVARFGFLKSVAPVNVDLLSLVALPFYELSKTDWVFLQQSPRRPATIVSNALLDVIDAAYDEQTASGGRPQRRGNAGGRGKVRAPEGQAEGRRRRQPNKKKPQPAPAPATTPAPAATEGQAQETAASPAKRGVPGNVPADSKN